VTVDDVLAHCRTMASSVTIPVSADFEGGYAVEPSGVAANVAAAAATGLAGLSIEDSTGKPAQPLFDRTLAIERIAAAHEAIQKSGVDLLLTGRSEGFIAGRPDLDETIRRLTAYAEAGADCLHAPGLRSLDDIAQVVRAVAPKPVNVLVHGGFTTLAALTEIGVRRISVGGALARTAWAGFLEAATEIATLGTFTSLDRGAPSGRVNDIFKQSR
jgi:methylisocitrate lyase